jgi:HEAT repeat protein
MKMIDRSQLDRDIRTLERGNETARRQTIHSLKQNDGHAWAALPLKVIRPLVAALRSRLHDEHEHSSVRQEVAALLGDLGPMAGPAVPELVALLQEGIPDGVREAAVTALGKVGEPSSMALDRLLALATLNRPALAAQAVRTLGTIGGTDERVRAALVDLWLSPSQPPKIQAEVATTLCKLKIRARGLLLYLIGTLVAGRDAFLRRAAAEALGWCDQEEVDVVPALLTAALQDKDEELRQAAQASLERLGLSSEQAILICTKQLKESAHAETALRKSGQPAVPALISVLGTGDPAMREIAARILGSIGEPAAEAVRALTTSLRHKDPDLRLAAAKALWNITHSAEVVVPVLVNLLVDKKVAAQHPGESRRRFLQAAIESLGRIGPPAEAAVPALTTLAKDENRLVSASARQAMDEISPPVAVKTAVRERTTR